MKATCMKEKKEVEVKNPEYVLSNGRASVRGVCPNCGTKVNKFIGRDKLPAGIKDTGTKKKGGASRKSSSKRSRKSSRKSKKSKPTRKVSRKKRGGCGCGVADDAE